jgi:hypothetical protein
LPHLGRPLNAAPKIAAGTERWGCICLAGLVFPHLRYTLAHPIPADSMLYSAYTGEIS